MRKLRLETFVAQLKQLETSRNIHNILVALGRFREQIHPRTLLDSIHFQPIVLKEQSG